MPMDDKKIIYLIQKNARCPVCGGILKYCHNESDLIIRCVTCKVEMKVIDDGYTECEFKAEVTKPPVPHM